MNKIFCTLLFHGVKYIELLQTPLSILTCKCQVRLPVVLFGDNFY